MSQNKIHLITYYRLGFGVKPHGLEYGESYGTVAGRMVSWSEIGTITAIAWQRTNHLGPFSGPSDGSESKELGGLAVGGQGLLLGVKWYL